MSRRISVSILALLVSAMVILVHAGVAEAQVVPDGLIAYWTFDDIEGDIVKDSAGDFDGTITEGTLPQVPGKVGQALEFNDNAYIDTGSEVTELGAASWSMTVWIKTESVNNPIFSKCNGNAAWECPNEKQCYVAAPPASEGPNTGPVEYVGCACDWIRGSIEVHDNEWHHVALTWDFANKEGHMYTDGEEGTFHMGYNGGADNVGDIVRVGYAAGFHSIGFFIGLMDDFRFYDRALEPDEVLEIMAEKMAVSSTGKLAVTWGEVKTSS